MVTITLRKGKTKRKILLFEFLFFFFFFFFFVGRDDGVKCTLMVTILHIETLVTFDLEVSSILRLIFLFQFGPNRMNFRALTGGLLGYRTAQMN